MKDNRHGELFAKENYLIYGDKFGMYFYEFYEWLEVDDDFQYFTLALASLDSFVNVATCSCNFSISDASTECSNCVSSLSFSFAMLLFICFKSDIVSLLLFMIFLCS